MNIALLKPIENHLTGTIQDVSQFTQLKGNVTLLLAWLALSWTLATVGVLISAVDGVFYSVLRYRYGTLWAAVLAHGFLNTIGFVSVFLLGPVHGLW